MLQILRRRDFALLWLGGGLSSIGDVILFIALPFRIYTLTGSTLATGLLFIAQIVPSLLIGSFAGVMADRWNRQRALILIDTFRMLLMLLLLFVHSPTMVWIVYIVVFAESATGIFFDPAKNALLPHLVNDDQVLSANAVNTLSGQLVGLVGPLIGAALVSILGFNGLVLLDSASYGLSVLLIACIQLPPLAQSAKQRDNTSDTVRLPTLWGDFRDGMKLVHTKRWISAVFIFMSIIALAQGMVNILLIPYIDKVLQGGTSVLGSIVTAQSLGGLIGSIVVGRFGTRLAPVGLLVVSTTLLGCAWFVIAHTAILPLVLASMVVGGIAGGGVFITVPTMLQQGIDDVYRGRVFGFLGTIQSLVILVGMGVASVVGEYTRPTLLLNVIGMLALLAGGSAFVILRPALHKEVHQEPTATSPYGGGSN